MINALIMTPILPRASPRMWRNTCKNYYNQIFLRTYNVYVLTPRILRFWCEWPCSFPSVCWESAEVSWAEPCSWDEYWLEVSYLACWTMMSLATAGCIEFSSTEVLSRLISEILWLPESPVFSGRSGKLFGNVAWLSSFTMAAGWISRSSTSSRASWEWLWPWECPCSGEVERVSFEFFFIEAVDERYLPWKRTSPNKFAARPAHPVISTQTGSVITWGLTKRSIQSINSVKHRASRKTPFISAPRISARCQP